MSHEIVKGLDIVGLTDKNGREDRGWHGLGTPIRSGMSAVEAGEECKLFFPIAQYPLYAKSPSGELIEVDSHVLNVRTRNNADEPIDYPLGVVGAGYSVCENRELAEFADALAQTGKCEIETVGSLQGGKKLFFLAKGAGFNIQSSDKVWDYLCVSNSHDGTNAIHLTPTSTRVVCWNTLHLVIPVADDQFARPSSAAYSIRHTGRIKDKLEVARVAMANYLSVVARNRELFEAMAATRIERSQAIELFAGAYAANFQAALPEELASTDKEEKRLAENRFKRQVAATDSFLKRYDDEKSKLGLADSPWLAFNAVSGWFQHDLGARGKDDGERVQRRVESNLFGLNARRTNEALAGALALAG